MLLNIFVGFAIIVLTIIIQAYGTIFWVSEVDKRGGLSSLNKTKYRGALVLISTAVFLISIHIIQAALWALIYLWLPDITEFETFEKSMYFSLVTFTTLGYGDITLSSGNRILAGLEAINGITLIGWSTAFMFAIFQRLIKVNIKNKPYEKV